MYKLINRKLTVVLLFFSFLLVGCNSDQEEISQTDYVEGELTNLLYEIPIIEIPDVGEIISFTEGCMISKGGPFNLVQIKEGDIVENNDRLVGYKECSISIKIRNKFFGKKKFKNGFDYVFHIERI